MAKKDKPKGHAAEGQALSAVAGPEAGARPLPKMKRKGSMSGTHGGAAR